MQIPLHFFNFIFFKSSKKKKQNSSGTIWACGDRKKELVFMKKIKGLHFSILSISEFGNMNQRKIKNDELPCCLYTPLVLSFEDFEWSRKISSKFVSNFKGCINFLELIEYVRKRIIENFEKNVRFWGKYGIEEWYNLSWSMSGKHAKLKGACLRTKHLLLCWYFNSWFW